MSEPKPTWYAPLNVERISEHSFHTSDGLVQVVPLAIAETLAREVLQLRDSAARVFELLPVVRAEGVYNEWATPAAYNEARQLLEDALKGQGVHDDVSS